uniref:Major capsid protein C-terminal domain-containing protein n=1 Tax=viral metagenome TaxID=1070528 RepID=A0A6C0J324_9ZZZZ
MNDNNLNYNYFNPLKFFMNKIWEEDITNNEERGLTSLFKDFNQKLDLVQNLDGTKEYSGVYLDDTFNENNFGLFSLNKINTPDFNNSVDKYYLPIIKESKDNILINNNIHLLNKIDSNELFSYLIDLKNVQVTFKNVDLTKNNFTIEIYNYNFSTKNINILIENPILISSNLIQFYSKEMLKNYDNLSIRIDEEYIIKNYVDYGRSSTILLEYDIDYNNVNNPKIFINEKEMTVISYSNKEIVFSGLINNINNYIKLTSTNIIEKYKYVKNNYTQINFVNNTDSKLSRFYFINTIVYIIIDNIRYDLKYDYINKIFYINSNIFNESNINTYFKYTNKIITLFKLINFTNYKENDYLFAKIELNKKISNYLYNIQTDSSIPFNLSFKNNEISLKNIKLDTANTLKIEYNGNINNILNKKLVHNYKLNESINYRIYTIKYLRQYLYKIKNIFNFTKNEDLNLEIDILFDFNNDELNSLRKIKCDLSDVDSENINILVTYPQKLLDYDNGKIFTSTDIINNSTLHIYKTLKISEEIMMRNVIGKDMNNNVSRLYLISTLPSSFLYSEFYRIPELIETINEKFYVNNYFYEKESFKLKFITELIAEFIWDSSDTFEFKTQLPELIKEKQININYDVSNLTLTCNDIYYWGGDSSNTNLKNFLKSKNFKVIEIDNIKYLLIRAEENLPSETFVSSILPYTLDNDSNNKIELTINKTFSVSNNYKFSKKEFDESVTNISLNKLKIKKTFSNLTSLFKLTLGTIYNYELLFSISNVDIGVSIINIIEYNDRFEIDIDKNIIVNKSLYKGYNLIEKLKNLKFEKNEYFELFELEFKNDIPVLLNQSTILKSDIRFVDSKANNLSKNYIYFSNIITTKEIKYTNQMYLLVNNNLLIIDVISMTYFIDNTYYILFTINTNIKNNDVLKLYSFDFSDNYDIINFTSLNKFYYNTIYELKIYKIDNTKSKMYIQAKENELYFFKILSILNSNNGYTNKLERLDNMILFKFRYEKIKFTNNSYNNIEFNKVPDKIIKERIITNEDVRPIWIKDLAIKFFESINFVVNNNIIEKLDYNTMNILYSFNFDIYKETSFDRIVRLRNDGSNLYFYYPIKFFFMIYNKFLPVCVMKNADLIIEFKLNKLNKLLKNSNLVVKNVKPLLDIYYTTCVLPKEIIYKLQEETSIILAQVNYNYSEIIISNEIEEHTIEIYNIVKDLFISIEKVGLDNMYTAQTDKWYTDYLKKYNSYMNNKLEAFSEDINLFKTIDNEILIKSNRVNILKSNTLLNKYDIKYIIYLDEKYLNYINEDLNNTTNVFSQKISLLVMYFKNIHQNQMVNGFENGILDEISFTLNGTPLIQNLSGKYYNDVTPYFKGYSLDDNYYTYSFGLNSKVNQPNGSLNLKMIDNFQMTTKKNKKFEKAKLKIYTKEYRFLKIENNNVKLIF